MSENGYLKITEHNLEELIKLSSTKTVGKILKRFEIHDNHQVLKDEVRELLYESYRDFRDLLIASGKGLHVTQFKFAPKGKTHTAS